MEGNLTTEPLSINHLAETLRARFENVPDHQLGKTLNILYLMQPWVHFGCFLLSIHVFSPSATAWNQSGKKLRNDTVWRGKDTLGWHSHCGSHQLNLEMLTTEHWLNSRLSYSLARFSMAFGFEFSTGCRSDFFIPVDGNTMLQIERLTKFSLWMQCLQRYR